jgi:hypothetical protein
MPALLAAPLPPTETDWLTLRLEAIFLNPGICLLGGETGNVAVPRRGLRKCGVDFILAGERGGLSGPIKVLGTFLVVMVDILPPLPVSVDERVELL